MKPILVALLLLPLFGCGKSNESHVSDIENQLNEILSSRDVTKEIVQEYLEKHNYEYQETTKEKCRKFSSGDFSMTCEFPFYIHTRIPVEKVFNPIESGAHVYFFFGSEGNLVKHNIHMVHSFL